MPLLLPDADELALLTDLYQLTMAAGYWTTGRTHTRAVFELFVRRLPPDRSYLLTAGLDTFVEYVRQMRFSSRAIDALRGLPMFADISPGFFGTLSDFSFRGEIDAMPEGTIAFAGEPILRVTGGLMESQLLETIALATVQPQTLIASKAARVAQAARGRPVVEFGLRRAHGPQAGLMAARAALIAGCRSTSNVLAASWFGVEPAGTMAHSWIMSAESESGAMASFADCFPRHTTALVDTYDVEGGLKAAVRLGARLTAIRLDSGDRAAQARTARAFLDANGCAHTRIFVTGDLNEFEIDALLSSAAPIDAFGVGTEMVTSYDAPALSMVYKLAAIEGPGHVLRPVSKSSQDKATLGGAKQVYRRCAGGAFAGDVVGPAGCDGVGEPLLQPVMRDGQIVGSRPTISQISTRAAEQIASLPESLRALRGNAGYPVTIDRRLTVEPGRTG